MLRGYRLIEMPIPNNLQEQGRVHAVYEWDIVKYGLAFFSYSVQGSHHALVHFASHLCSPSSIAGLGRGRMCEKFHQLLAVGRWFPPGTPVSSTRGLISSSSSFHRLDMTLAIAEALNPNKPKYSVHVQGL